MRELLAERESAKILGISNSLDQLVKSDSLNRQEGLEIEKHFVLYKSGKKAWSQKGSQVLPWI